MTRLPAQATTKIILDHEPCQACGRPIEVTSPEWYRITFNLTDPKNYRATWSYNPAGNAFCVSCQLERVDPANAPALAAQLEGLQVRKRVIGLPDDVTMFHHRTLNKHVYGAVNGVFNFDEYFCHIRGAIPQEWTIPRRLIHPDDGSEPLTLLYAGSDVHLQGVGARAFLTWDIARPTAEGQLQIGGWSQVTPSDFGRLMEGVRVFLMRQSVGRPRDTTDRTLADYERDFREVTAKLGHKPRSVDEFSEHTGIPSRTAKRNLKRWGLTWGQFKQVQPSP